MILFHLDIAKTPVNIGLLPKLLVPLYLSSTVCSPVLSITPSYSLVACSAATPSEEGFSPPTIKEFTSNPEALSAQEVQVQQLPGQSVIFARNFAPASVLPEEFTASAIVDHSLHGNEGELVEKFQVMPVDGEL